MAGSCGLSIAQLCLVLVSFPEMTATLVAPKIPFYPKDQHLPGLHAPPALLDLPTHGPPLLREPGRLRGGPGVHPHLRAPEHPADATRQQGDGRAHRAVGQSHFGGRCAAHFRTYSCGDWDVH